MDQTEAQIQRAIRDFLDIALPDNCIWFAVPNGEKRDKITAAKLVGQGVKPGVPDIIVVWAYGAVGLEVKTKKGHLSKAQRDFFVRAEAAGMRCVVVRSVNEVEQTLRKFGIALKARAA